MPLPVNDDGADALFSDDTLSMPRAPRRRLPWMLAALLVAVPLLLTLAGVLTSPPRAARVPTGRIIFLEADQPSEHTSLLRGLRITMPGSGGSRELLHETEPQDVDAGSRDWITQPVVSPDGRRLAYEKQLITLQEEKTGIVNQLWALPLDNPHAAPHLLADLTALHLKQPIGLAWTPDSTRIVFLQDTALYSVNAHGTPRLTHGFLSGLPPLRTMPSLSATRSPAFIGPDTLTLGAQTAPGSAHPFFFHRESSSGYRQPDDIHMASSVWAVTPDGFFADLAAPAGRAIILRSLVVLLPPNEPAALPPNAAQRVARSAAFSSPPVRTLRARWGWSVFGGRRVTSLKWSPDGRYLGYTVSKPPFEDELFYADTATGKCYQLPIRTGRAAWDWTR